MPQRVRDRIPRRFQKPRRSQGTVAALPVAIDSYGRLQVHRAPQERLEFAAGAGPGIAQDTPTLPDHDPLLRIPFHPDDGPQSQEIGGVRASVGFEFLDRDGDRMRELVPSRPEELLAHQFGRKNVFRLIGDHAVRVVLGTLRQSRLQRPHQLVEAFAGAGRAHGTMDSN